MTYAWNVIPFPLERARRPRHKPAPPPHRPYSVDGPHHVTQHYHLESVRPEEWRIAAERDRRWVERNCVRPVALEQSHRGAIVEYWFDDPDEALNFKLARL